MGMSYISVSLPVIGLVATKRRAMLVRWKRWVGRKREKGRERG